MAVSKKLKVDSKTKTPKEEEKVVAVNFEEEMPPVFTMLCGYTDENGVNHKEYTLREMNGKDQEAINKADVKVNGSKVVATLLIRCVQSIGSITRKDVGTRKWEEIIKSIYTGDQDLMLIELRKLSMGDEITLNHVCPQCKEKLQTLLSLDELDIAPFKGEEVLEFSLPKGYKDRKGTMHKEGVMRLPTGFDREILTPVAKNNLARAETVMLTRLCKFSDDSHIDEDVMGNLTVRDREYLQNLLKEHFFGVILEVDIDCSSCGETFKGTLNAQNFI